MNRIYPLRLSLLIGICSGLLPLSIMAGSAKVPPHYSANGVDDVVFPTPKQACDDWVKKKIEGGSPSSRAPERAGGIGYRCFWKHADGSDQDMENVYLGCPLYAHVDDNECVCDSHYASNGKDCVPEEVVASNDPRARPTANSSEDFTAGALKDLGQKSQQSFIRGQPTKYGKDGSTRPDSYVESLSLAVEVKNYDLTKGTSALVSNVATQAKKRQKELPEGSKQALVIDIRGQKVSDSVLNRMFEDINARSGNLFENRWWVLMD